MFEIVDTGARLESLQGQLHENLGGRSGSGGAGQGIKLGFDYVVEARWPSE
jgi:hypothetical protein